MHEWCLKYGLIREIDPARGVLLWECNCQAYVEPIWVPDSKHGTIGVYGCGDDECGGTHYIKPERMRQWVVNFAGLAAAVSSALGLEGGQEVAPGRVAYLGALTREGVYREFFLARGLWWADAATMISRCARLTGSPAPAILMVDRLPDVVLWKTLRPAVLALGERIGVHRNRFQVDVASLFCQTSLPHTAAPAENWLTVSDAAK